MELQCFNCGIPIRWQPTVIGERIYCCVGCARGGPCICGFHQPLHEFHDQAIIIWRKVRTEIVHLVKEE